MSDYIKKLISEGEHECLDFKFAINDASKIAKTFSAFANTKGGRLLIGVKDNGVIAGIRSEEEYYMIQSASQLYTSPNVDFKAQTHNINGKQVLEIIIEKGENIPYKAKSDNSWLAYIRKKDQNFLANNILIKLWHKEKKKEGIIIRYREDENAFLRLFSSDSSFTLSAITKKTNISRKKAEEILSSLLYFKLVEYEVDEKGFRYRICENIDL